MQLFDLTIDLDFSFSDEFIYILYENDFLLEFSHVVQVCHRILSYLRQVD
jgi:hypothetical protein